MTIASNQLTAEEKLSRQNDLIQMTVHDLKGPIMEIIANLDLVANSPAISEDEKLYAETALEGAQELYEMVTDMLNLGKMEAGALILEKAEFDMGSLAENIVKKYSQTARDKRVNMTFAQKGNLAVTADEKLIARVIANLLSNGLKFSPPETSLTVSVEDAGEFVAVKIRDEGPGIPEEYRNSIFDKYVQVELRTHRRKGGTGLGLPFCRMTVEKHGGKIGVENREPGSEFYFSIPRSEAEKSQV